MKRTFFALLGTLVMSGCQLPGAPPALVEDAVMLQVAPSFTAGRKVQAVVDNYTQASIRHMVVKLFKVDAASELELAATDITDNAKLTSPVTFTKLKQNTTYRIRAYAYKADGTAGADQISDDAASTVDIPVATNNTPPLAKLQVKLVDIGFSGQATSEGTTIVPGGYSNAGPEAIVAP